MIGAPIGGAAMPPRWPILRHDAPGSEHPKALWRAAAVVVEARNARCRRFRDVGSLAVPLVSRHYERPSSADFRLHAKGRTSERFAVVYLLTSSMISLAIESQILSRSARFWSSRGRAGSFTD